MGFSKISSCIWKISSQRHTIMRSTTQLTISENTLLSLTAEDHPP
jgi:hypothetical protein